MPRVKHIPIKSILFFFVVALLLSQEETTASVNPEYLARIEREKYAKIGEDVAIFAYPLVMMDTLCKQQTYTNAPTQFKAPINQFAHEKKQATPLDTTIVYPNIDGLFSRAWLNLSREPQIIRFPAILKRYFLFELFDGWTNCIATIDPQTLGDEAKEFMIAGPNYKGHPPAAGMAVIRSNSSLVNIKGLIQCFGPNDYEKIYTIQDGMQIMPRSQYGDDYSPPALLPLSHLAATKEKASDQLLDMPSKDFFDSFAYLLETNPLTPQDMPLSKSLEAIGIKQRGPFDVEAINPCIEGGLSMAWHEARGYIEDNYGCLFSRRGHWTTMIRKEKDFGTDYTRRALVARAHLPCTLSQNMLTFTTDSDIHGIRLHGTTNYRLRFPKNSINDSAKLWSVTLYTSENSLFINPINLYAIQSFASSLETNDDGSIDIYIQRFPLVQPKGNWLPCPMGNFKIMIRLYQPSDEGISFHPPEIRPLLSRDSVE